MSHSASTTACKSELEKRKYQQSAAPNLVLLDVINADLGVLFFPLELEFNIQQGNLEKIKDYERRHGCNKQTFGFVYDLGCISKPAYEKVFLKATPWTN